MKRVARFVLFLLIVSACSVNTPLPPPDEEVLSEVTPINEEENEGFFPLTCCCNEKPAPFEKIYVHPCEILCTPFGSFHVAPNGCKEPIRAIRQDCCGTYIIKITHVCPVCGRQYKTKFPPEGFACPLWEIEIEPHVWSCP